MMSSVVAVVACSASALRCPDITRRAVRTGADCVDESERGLGRLDT
jgi:hypothetical protein